MGDTALTDIITEMVKDRIGSITVGLKNLADMEINVAKTARVFRLVCLYLSCPTECVSLLDCFFIDLDKQKIILVVMLMTTADL